MTKINERVNTSNVGSESGSSKTDQSTKSDGQSKNKETSQTGDWMEMITVHPFALILSVCTPVLAFVILSCVSIFIDRDLRKKQLSEAVRLSEKA